MKTKFFFKITRLWLILITTFWLTSCVGDDTAPGGTPVVSNPLDDITLDQGFGTHDIDLTNTFSDPDNEILTLAVNSSNMDVISVRISGTTLTLTEEGTGTAIITVLAVDPSEERVSEAFIVTVTQ